MHSLKLADTNKNRLLTKCLLHKKYNQNKPKRQGYCILKKKKSKIVMNISHQQRRN